MSLLRGDISLTIDRVAKPTRNKVFNNKEAKSIDLISLNLGDFYKKPSKENIFLKGLLVFKTFFKNKNPEKFYHFKCKLNP